MQWQKFKTALVSTIEDTHNIFSLICGDPHPYVCILPLYKMHPTYKPSSSALWSSCLKWQKHMSNPQTNNRMSNTSYNDNIHKDDEALWLQLLGHYVTFALSTVQFSLAWLLDATK